MNADLQTRERHRRPGGLPLLLALLGVIVWLALAPHALAVGTPAATLSSTQAKPTAAAALEQCVTSANQAERSATFSGEMSAIPGAVKLQMRIDVLERTPHEVVFHAVNSPGLGVWRSAAPGVKSYKYVKQVTNLSAPAAYRAAVRFRWLNAKGRPIRSGELKTARCLQTPQGRNPVKETAPAA